MPSLAKRAISLYICFRRDDGHAIAENASICFSALSPLFCRAVFVWENVAALNISVSVACGGGRNRSSCGAVALSLVYSRYHALIMRFIWEDACRGVYGVKLCRRRRVKMRKSVSLARALGVMKCGLARQTTSIAYLLCLTRKRQHVSNQRAARQHGERTARI